MPEENDNNTLPTGWEPLAAAAVESELTPQEQAAIARLQGADSLPAIMARVTAEIRGYIRSGQYRLDPAPAALPLSLHNTAVAIVRWRLIASTSALKPFATEPRKLANERAEKLLEKIGDSKWAPEAPILSDEPPLVTGDGCWGSDNRVLPRTFPGVRPARQFPGNLGNSNPDAPATF